MKWIYNKEKISEELKKENKDIHPILLQLLYNRGIKTKTEIQEFLNSNLYGDPYQIPDMKKFVDRVLLAKERKETVAIHGDYDVDGVSSSAIVYIYLKEILGIEDVQVYIPNRFDEGYGVSTSTIEKLAKEKVNLLITVDCGIKDVEEVDFANKKVIDVIISDHHIPGEKLPNALAIIHTMYYEYKGLSGAGVALKMVQALDKRLGLDYAKEFVDLAGLGTLCDIMELKGENRVIVKDALNLLKSTKREGLKSLFSITGLDGKVIETYHVGYVIGPRINASGRLASAKESFKLLVTKDKMEAEELSKNLNDINRQRQDETIDALDRALGQINREEYINVVYIPGISVGVIGLVAGKLKEMTNLPSIVLTDDSELGLLSGSGRSIDDFNIVESLDNVKDLLKSYGGHKKAAGLKVKKEDLENLKKRMEKYTKELLLDKDHEKRLFIDMQLDLDTNLKELYMLANTLEPYGESNPKPIFTSKASVSNTIYMGENGKHLKVFLERPNGQTIEAVGFNMGDRIVKKGDELEVAYNIGRNVWKDREYIQLMLIDLKINP